MQTYKFLVPEEKRAEVIRWIADGRGVTLWKCLDLSLAGRTWITPGDAEKPHWSAGEPESIGQSELGMSVPVPIPDDWFPVCEHCQGTGRRSVASLAEARGESTDSVSVKLASGEIHVTGFAPDTAEFDCTWCQGTGHVEREIRVALRRKYWGYDISDTGKKRAERCAKKLGQGVSWDWQGVGFGLASLLFFRIESLR